MSARDAMREFLVRVGQMPLHQGPDAAGKRAPAPTTADVAFLQDLASAQSTRNAVTLNIVLALICATFVATALGAWQKQDATAVAAIVVGGTGGGIGLLAWLRALWSDSNMYTVILIASQRLSADDLVKLIAGLYFERRDRKTAHGVE